MNLLKTSAVAVAGAAVATGLMTPTASAADATQVYSEQTKQVGSSEPGAGWVGFDNSGETFDVVDFDADGRGVEVLVEVNGKQLGHNLWNYSGSGSTQSFDENFPEGANVKITVCLIEDGVTIINGSCASESAKA